MFLVTFPFSHLRHFGQSPIIFPSPSPPTTVETGPVIEPEA